MPALRILITVSLNDNQLRAHLEPLVALEEVQSVTLVADHPAPEISKLRCVVPNPTLVRIVGRATAKFLLCLGLALRDRPQWIIGLNLVPHGVTAMVVAKATGAASVFYMIGGPREFLGGGWTSDNAVLGRLQRPIFVLERMLFRIVRACDFIAVMGSGARQVLIERGVPPQRVIAIPACIDGRRYVRAAGDTTDYDLVTVSQLIPRKRLDDFLRAVAKLRYTHPRVRAAIVGYGRLEPALRALADRLGVDDAVDFLGFRPDIEKVYARSKVFVLTSRSEGLSIAIAEAMASALAVVVTDVGEVRDLVRDGENGYVFSVGDIDALVERVGELLDDPSRCDAIGASAAADALRSCGLERISNLYRDLLLKQG